MAFCSSGRRFGGGGLDLARRPTILVLACWARQESDRFRPPSTTATISRTGILFGAGAKFRPLLKTPLSAFLSSYFPAPAISTSFIACTKVLALYTDHH